MTDGWAKGRTDKVATIYAPFREHKNAEKHTDVDADRLNWIEHRHVKRVICGVYLMK